VSLTIEDAKKIVAAAQEHARSLDCKVTVAVADTSGRLIYLERMDGAHPIGSNIAPSKACGSAVIRRDGHEIRKVYDERRPNYDALVGWMHAPMYPGGGSVPVLKAGEHVGAVGCSGCPNDRLDHECVVAGAAAIGSHYGQEVRV
jgi:glc operon protein GlcG